MTRSDLHATFVKRFAKPRKKPVSTFSLEDIRVAEKKAGTVFPASFVAFLGAHGAVWTPDILDLVVAANESGPKDFEGWDVSEFLAPSEISSTHAMYAKGGMDESVIPFASDSSGNVFGFRRSKAPDDDASVLFFDHDFCEVRPEADSFDRWIERFLSL